MKRASQILIFLVCVGFTVSAAYNVFSDNAEVERMGRAVACGDEGATCAATMTRLSRTPFGQAMEFNTRKRAVGVKCVRSLVLVGEYRCELQ